MKEALYPGIHFCGLLPFLVAVAVFCCCAEPLWAQPAGTGAPITTSTDPLTRYVHVTYRIPEQAGDEVLVVCTWSPSGEQDWRPAKVMPLVSDSALRLVTADEWGKWALEGTIVERRAAGLERTLALNPYPDAQVNGIVDIDFRIELLSSTGEVLSTQQTRIQADNRDVVYVEDWSRVFQRDAVSIGDEVEDGTWHFRTGLQASEHVSLGNLLYGDAGPDSPLPQLTYPLDLKGPYAVFVCSQPGTALARLRLTGDERTDRPASRLPFEEVLWRWTSMDRQHLVLKQPYRYTGYAATAIDYIKLVPLMPDLVEKLDAQFADPDKVVAGYWEPYSWAFHDNVQEPLQHREPLIAFAEARVAILDTQIGRFGAKVVYESRLTDPLLYATQGDPIGTVTHPQTDNVGRMQQHTNTLETELRHARELGLTLHANFGASNCYPGSPLQGDFSKAHPEWMRGSALRYEVPEVREYALSLYREALTIGAPAISLDFCRYPETIDTPETCNTFLSALRDLADETGRQRGEHVPILVRFPGTGVRRHELFDYATWARENWVDFLCPSNIQGRHLHIDVAPYIEAVRGTQCKLLPCIDGLSWGLPMPGPYLWRAHQLYQQGVPGIYVYQADSRVLNRPLDRRCMRILSSGNAVAAWWENELATRPRCSKGIYITPPNRYDGYHAWERLRVWTEGIEMGAIEMHLDGQLVSQFEGPPYLLGTEDYESDGLISTGEHELRIRAQDGDGWLEQTFTIVGAG